MSLPAALSKRALRDALHKPSRVKRSQNEFALDKEDTKSSKLLRHHCTQGQRWPLYLALLVSLALSLVACTSPFPVARLLVTSILTSHGLPSEIPIVFGAERDTGPHSNGRTQDVQWDGYSLILKGRRIFLQ
jgi:hypothetical protein